VIPVVGRESRPPAGRPCFQEAPPDGVHGMKWFSSLVVLGLLTTACTRDVVPPHEERTTPSSSPIEGPLVDPKEIVSGGVPPDGIPPIDDPTFVESGAVRFLDPKEPVVAVEVRGVAKAYPVRILMWHEIVNDVFDGVPVVVTYCPLCNTGISFRRPTVDGELLDFGTSGKLYRSNLVMYDRQTNSYWPQALGQAVVGPLLGMELEPVATRLLSWADWRSAHSDGRVLSQRTGYVRRYGSNPYVGYEHEERPPLFAGEPDPRLRPTEHVLGFAGSETIAFPYSELERLADGGVAAVNRTVGGERVAVFWKTGTVSALDAALIPLSADVGAAAAYDPRVDGRRLTFIVDSGRIFDQQTGSEWTIAGEAIAGPLVGSQLEVAIALDGFWFTWAAFHPETQVFRAAARESGALRTRPGSPSSGQIPRSESRVRAYGADTVDTTDVLAG
jgi:Protein of unknown function (DUF3179)